MSVAFVSRADAFAARPVLHRHLIDWQAQTFILQEVRYEEGEEVIMELGDEEATILSAEQAAAMNRETEEHFTKILDAREPAPPELGEAATIIAELEAPDMRAFAARIGDAAKRLFGAMAWNSIAVLAWTREPILTQENDYRQAASAEQALRDAGITKDFTGAITGGPSDIAALFGPLFWIARCNASAPYIVFGSEGSATVGTFCKYANLHFDVYDAGEQARLTEALRDSGFEIAEDGICNERFSETGAIDGRRIDI